ncbi:DNA mismatch repair endonuclease MutL [Thermovibrio sp.]
MIDRLPEEVIKEIASGQIAESPKAVLKELIENALDAQSTEIKVEIENPFNFKVVDNGIGIGYRELPLAVERFTTSKVKRLEDLRRLRTYGFRGEALYAISQFSKLTIKSKKRGERVGGIIRVEGGEVKEHRPFPYKGGTAVEVRELFFNAPVRRKATGRTEKALMVKLSKLYAMAHPEVEFVIGRERLFRSSLRERIYRITGLEFQIVKGNRFTLFFSKEEGKLREVFLNGRPVSLPELEKILEERGLRSYALFLEVEPEKVDFNLSPLKERALIEDKEVFKEVRERLKEELSLPKVFTFKDKEVKYSKPIEIIGSDGTVIIGHDDKFYYFFDQHLIHERLNYELLLKELREGKVELSPVYPPIEVKESLKEKLVKLGVLFKEEGEKLKVLSIPKILTIEDIKRLDAESVDSVAQIACKRAIKARYRFKRWEEVKELFKEYLKCEEREVCPHGRPIYYKIPKERVYRQLGRKLK